MNLARAKPPVDFVFLKATDGKKGGAMFVDRTFAPRWRRLADLGIPRGAYHYARPNTSPADQAAHFIAVVQASGFQAGDVAILDMEDRGASKGLSPSALRKWVDRWVAEVRRILPIRIDPAPLGSGGPRPRSPPVAGDEDDSEAGGSGQCRRG